MCCPFFGVLVDGTVLIVLVLLCSHVDLRTQYSYQAMEPRFVGLIFSVYNSDPTTLVETREIIAFQAKAKPEVYSIMLYSTYTIKASKSTVGTGTYKQLFRIGVFLFGSESDFYS